MGKKPTSGQVPQAILISAKSIIPAAVVTRLGKQRTFRWPAAVAGAQGQGMGASSARSSKVQLKHGITSGATLPAQLSPSLHWSNSLSHTL